MARDIPVRFRKAKHRLLGSASESDIEPVAMGASGAPSSRPYRACYAPSVHLYFQPDGDVRACCLNLTYPLGNVAEQGLLDIWHGERRADLQARLAADDFSRGCETCASAISNEGRENSYPRSFDDKATHLTDDPSTGAWPRFMEFNLSNACNLQCIQCNGELSSAIRIHREHREPLPKVYGDAFFDDLRLFLPHLTHVQVAGGEPFLGSENFRLWDLIAAEAPHITCGVVTNATQWNARVERALDMVPMNITFSIDGITKSTYEGIRVDADFDEVMANLDRFCQYAQQVGTTLQINHCLMVQNYHEFGDLLLFAEERGILVGTSVVRYPESASIACLPPDELDAVHQCLRDQSDRVLPALELNAAAWRTELERIGAWASARHRGYEPRATLAAGEPVILGLKRAGNHRSDASAARAALAGDAGGDGDEAVVVVVHEITIGPGGIITDCSPAVAALLGCRRTELIGEHTDSLERSIVARFGPKVDADVLRASEDEVALVVRYGAARLRTTVVATRDDDGWATDARILFVVDDAGSS